MERSDGGRFEIRLNGEPRQVEGGTTLADLVVSLGFDARTVAVERNGEIVPRRGYPDTTLAADDRLEIVRFVQGG